MLKGKENDFNIALQTNLVAIRKDMEKLKDAASGEAIKSKKEKKMVQLTEERDWFRAEALKLNIASKKQASQLKSLRERLSVASEERDYYLRQLYDEKATIREMKKELNDLKLKKISDLKNSGNLKSQLMQQSAESIKRLGADLIELDESDPVQEYKFLS